MRKSEEQAASGSDTVGYGHSRLAMSTRGTYTNVASHVRDYHMT
nr:hypothetical protein [uncultured Pseudoalteromonas sp.]